MIHRILGALATAGIVAVIHAADPAWPDLPDPIGLGPRLVTIGWLGDHGHRITPGASDAEIQSAYDRLQAARTGQIPDAVAIARDEESRLRYLLRANHAIDPAAGTALDALAALLAAAEARQRQAELAASAAPAGRISLVTTDLSTPVAGAPDPVPLRHQIRFEDLVWKVERTGSDAVIWRRGGGDRLPDDLGCIWARWVKWNGTSYRILSYLEEQPEPTPRFVITTEVGTFHATRLTERAWEVVFTDNAGIPLTFRSNASELLIIRVAHGTKEHRMAQDDRD